MKILIQNGSIVKVDGSVIIIESKDETKQVSKKESINLPTYQSIHNKKVKSPCVICGNKLGKYKWKVCSKACAKIRWNELTRKRLAKKRALQEDKLNRINVPVRWEE
jgi:predicted nucleic acid-binding Zn ribbon protein